VKEMVTLQITLVMGYLFPYFGDTIERGVKAEEMGGETEGDFMDNSIV